jgi:hypothetical protein
MHHVWVSGYSTRLVVHDEQACSEFESGGGQNFRKQGSQVPRNKIGVIPQGTRGGLRGAQKGGQGRYGSPVNQKL